MGPVQDDRSAGVTTQVGRAIIRVDGSAEIGRGHLLRCRHLAVALSMKGIRSTFVRRGPQDDALAGWPVHWISDVALDTDADSNSDDARRTLAATGVVGGGDVIIVDHYGLDSVWHAAVRHTGAAIVVIDDLADRQYDCDVLIDTNPLPMDRYTGRVPTTTHLLTGPSYALLEPETNVSHGAMSGREGHKDGSGPVRSILVSLGGGSTAAGLEVVLPALRDPRLGDVAVDVVLGDVDSDGRARAWDLAGGSQRRAPLTVHGWADDLPRRMANADLAVGAGGLSTWERMRAGLPSVVIAVAPNQEPSCRALDADGLIAYVGPLGATSAERIADVTVALVDDGAARQDMVRRGRQLVDGAGAQRCSAVIAGIMAGSGSPS